MPKNMKFHGILALGRTKTDAINNYRLLALNKGATVQVDSERSISFVTQASDADGLFNPASGNMDLEVDASLMEQLDFQSNSGTEVEVNHLWCGSGCGSHVVFDSADLVKFCPHCTSSLSEDCGEAGDDEDEADLESDSFDFESDSEDDGSEEDGDDSEEADDSDGEADDSDDDGSEEDSDDSDESEDSGDEAADQTPKKPAVADSEDELSELSEDDGAIVIGDGLDGDGVAVASDTYASALALFQKHAKLNSLSSGKSTVEVEYMVCSSSDCGAHILSDGEIVSCIVCSSDVVEPDENTLSLVEDELAEDDESEDDGSEEDGDDSEDTGDSDGDDSEDDGDDSASESADLVATTVALDLTRCLSSDDVSKLDVSYSSSIAGEARWTAYVGGFPVAMASKSSSGKNADIFDTPSFGHAVLATAKISGIRRTLSELGFAALTPEVSVSAEVKHMADVQVAEAREQLETQQNEFKERFAAALATAALGLNRGFYAGKKNPIKAALWTSMASAGIRNPEAMIDTVFKNHSDAYHKVLFGAASELIAQPLDAQESISKAIAGMSYGEVSASSDDIEHRLETFGTSVSSSTPAEAPKPANNGLERQAISKAVQSLGRRGR